VLRPCQQRMLAGGTEDEEHAMSQKLDALPAVTGIDISKNLFHIVGQNQRGATVLRQKWSRSQVETRLAMSVVLCIGQQPVDFCYAPLPTEDAW
jgi:transposase